MPKMDEREAFAPADELALRGGHGGVGMDQRGHRVSTESAMTLPGRMRT